MKDLCQSYLPYSPWDNIATSRLPGIQPLENKEMLFRRIEDTEIEFQKNKLFK